ncbi:phosphoribosyltransferase-like protein [Cantharellus anzutake]|uniref:phosphoribosyltransferase-like protein n=1 Tax=Cantharellus anzutake TaxID=1750568 RepID=UPI001905889D|nr:phosphoribosyltransferase-like protein [Cantharellus anzutake]KAF8328829.1 phosphoribosyltransferase-like protein [Cantharellus anzutake]
MHNGNSIKLLAGNSHMELAKLVAEHLGVALSPCEVKRFSNGEINVKIGQSIRDEDVFIIQSGCHDVNENLMELLILISACRTASARRITAVVPFSGPITAKLVANMLVTAGCDHLITMDLHAGQIQGFFDIPVDNLYSEPLMIKYVKSSIPAWQDAVIVSPDAGGAKRVTSMADKLGLDFALIHRKRESMELLVGNVKGKTCILVDDMIDTGVTLALATNLLSEAGAEKIVILVSHDPILSPYIGSSGQSIDGSDEEGGFVILDSIRRSHNGESFGILFGEGFWGNGKGRVVG